MSRSTAFVRRLEPAIGSQRSLPVFCGMVGVSEIQVSNPSPTSVYTWTTTDGNIVGSNLGPNITVDSPGTYIVRQQLSAGCSTYAMDTVTIAYDPTCVILESTVLNFQASNKGTQVQLSWTVAQNQDSRYYDVQRSINGQDFTTIARVEADPNLQVADYSATDDISKLNGPYVYYRLKLKSNMGYLKYSKVIPIALTQNVIKGVRITPNPVQDVMKVTVSSDSEKKIELYIYDVAGRLARTHTARVQAGTSTITLNGFKDWTKGIYVVKILMEGETHVEKIILTR